MAEEMTSNDVFDELADNQPTGATEASPPDANLQAEGDSQATDEPAEDIVANVKKETMGLKRALVEERNKRQQIEGRLAQITEMITKAQEAKLKTATEPESKEDEFEEVAVDFKEDGSPYIKLRRKQTSQSDEIISKVDQVVKSKLDAHMAQLNAVKAEQAALSKLLGSNPEYPARMQTVANAWKELNAMYDAYIVENDLPIPKTYEDAIIQIMETPALSGAFAKKFPNVDLLQLADAFVSPHISMRVKKLDRLLSSMGGTNGAKVDLSSLTRKPTNLSAVSNQAKSGDMNLIDRVSSMSVDDFMELSDSDMKKIQAYLAARE